MTNSRSKLPQFVVDDPDSYLPPIDWKHVDEDQKKRFVKKKGKFDIVFADIEIPQMGRRWAQGMAICSQNVEVDEDVPENVREKLQEYVEELGEYNAKWPDKWRKGTNPVTHQRMKLCSPEWKSFARHCHGGDDFLRYKCDGDKVRKAQPHQLDDATAPTTCDKFRKSDYKKSPLTNRNLRECGKEWRRIANHCYQNGYYQSGEYPDPRTRCDDPRHPVYLETECEQWKTERTKNPRTHRKISETGAAYEELRKQCDKNSPSKRVKPGQAQRGKTSPADCEKWKKSKKELSPFSGRRISDTGRLYRKLMKDCTSKNEYREHLNEIRPSPERDDDVMGRAIRAIEGPDLNERTCRNLVENSIDPNTGKKISRTGDLFRRRVSQCTGHRRNATHKVLQDNVYQAKDVCRTFKRDKSKNPLTGRKMTPWMAEKYDRACAEPDDCRKYFADGKMTFNKRPVTKPQSRTVDRVCSAVMGKDVSYADMYRWGPDRVGRLKDRPNTEGDPNYLEYLTSPRRRRSRSGSRSSSGSRSRSRSGSRSGNRSRSRSASRSSSRAGSRPAASRSRSRSASKSRRSPQTKSVSPSSWRNPSPPPKSGQSSRGKSRSPPPKISQSSGGKSKYHPPRPSLTSSSSESSRSRSKSPTRQQPAPIDDDEDDWGPGVLRWSPSMGPPFRDSPVRRPPTTKFVYPPLSPVLSPIRPLPRERPSFSFLTKKNTRDIEPQ